ncbi:uncharacterized protein LOC110830910 isoform X1 [Zootermopsis nevadensis]|uniref:uncharacterized protein LOC110830910 isoform X1 n=1 Tax=Zootermopsis nevadensis TaxID=136037 RepID=UPI000B8E83E9|nr:uncharacterized protein LOC110830910 isoform X1 [Zootermopsis nevadensis]
MFVLQFQVAVEWRSGYDVSDHLQGLDTYFGIKHYHDFSVAEEGIASGPCVTHGRHSTIFKTQLLKEGTISVQCEASLDLYWRAGEHALVSRRCLLVGQSRGIVGQDLFPVSDGPNK